MFDPLNVFYELSPISLSSSASIKDSLVMLTKSFLQRLYIDSRFHVDDHILF